ncbi:hypothetical protein DWB61_03765 [Ancylomarina euxinus]|uniref:Uncharacterized protein n=1 Tax=Ancylomarina euxinus TaxID=2283627 RepID=A0A425Y6U2_9BACT|nr:hypothetical protein [Ancylomarina euxinus]MBI9035476.1 hypothetical protein [Bacteroidales bacterium]MCZ4693881.1 hypothetical protein [Ancylomarina euxinus]MUP14699.1 hypothetical protein [Ancylomarina euxinus]RRG24243.1 hypothetical protein DWB61_03765 [Ancylomarina euxinus]
MKTSNLILIGGVAVAYFYRGKLFPYLDAKLDQATDSIKTALLSKLEIAPNGMPSVKLDLIGGELDLRGSVKMNNKTSLNTTLNTYQLDLILKKGTSQIVLGKTPLVHANTEIKGNSKNSLKYLFSVNLENLSKLISGENFNSHKVFIAVKSLQIDSINLPDVEIETNVWKEIIDTIKTIKNPSSFIQNLINNF